MVSITTLIFELRGVFVTFLSLSLIFQGGVQIHKYIYRTISSPRLGISMTYFVNIIRNNKNEKVDYKEHSHSVTHSNSPAIDLSIFLLIVVLVEYT